MDLIDRIAALAGWRTERWLASDQAILHDPDTGLAHAFGQSICELAPDEMHKSLRAGR